MAEELFLTVFAEISQTLQLADFLGTSENAIKWQIWTALQAYWMDCRMETIFPQTLYFS